MNKKEIVEQFKRNMPSFKGTAEEQEIKTALYIYTELGKTKSFDEKYYFGNAETKKKIYKLAQKESKNIDKVAKKRKIICVSLTHLYCEILREFGIQATPSVPEDDGHISAIIITKNNDMIEADLQLDLENIQTKSKLEHFNYKGNIDRQSHKVLEDREITNMLIEAGYIKNESDYKNAKIEKLKEKVKNKNAKEALETIVKDKEIYKDNEEMDIIELNKFYRGMLKKVVPDYLDKKIFLFSCYRKNEENEKDYTCCVFSDEHYNSPTIYLFSKKRRRFLETDINNLKQLKEEGLVLGAKPGELGTNILQKHINKSNKEEIYHTM